MQQQPKRTGWDIFTTIVSFLMMAGSLIWAYYVVRQTLALPAAPTFKLLAQTWSVAALKILGSWLGVLIMGMALNRRRFSQMMEGLRNLLIRATSVVYFLFMIAAFAITINAGWNLPSWMQGLTGGAILAFAILTILLKIALDRLIAWLTPSLGKHQRMDDQGGLHMI